MKMPRVNQLVNVVIKRNGVQGGKRSWHISVEARDGLFLLSDELARQGVIGTFEDSLRTTLRGMVAGYISSGRELIKGMGKKRGGGNERSLILGMQDKREGTLSS